MRLTDKRMNKKMKVSEIPSWGVYLLHDRDYTCGYLWHVFSWGKRKCFSGDKAVEVFNNRKKKHCYVFFQRSNEALLLDDANDLNLRDLAEESDIYVVDKDFKWTFVVTHEESCGPYFSFKK